jgi:catechol 2,3-dioxygenase-like lactoylglutathione lyase family enzyme
MSGGFVIARFDHIVLTVRDLAATLAFYERVLGARIVPPPADGKGSAAITFGRQKINIHVKGKEFEPKATHVTVGSGDFCLITGAPLADVRRHLEARGVAVELGPVKRQGALGPMMSVYFRDPDGNLVEVARYG